MAIKITTSRTQSWAVAFALVLKAVSAAKLFFLKSPVIYNMCEGHIVCIAGKEFKLSDFEETIVQAFLEDLKNMNEENTNESEFESESESESSSSMLQWGLFNSGKPGLKPEVQQLQAVNQPGPGQN